MAATLKHLVGLALIVVPFWAVDTLDSQRTPPPAAALRASAEEAHTHSMLRQAYHFSQARTAMHARNYREAIAQFCRVIDHQPATPRSTSIFAEK
jgi:hypothetical protein